MRPIILHNVPDEELYTGDDGIQRPYAMYWPEGDRQRNLPRSRVREVTESGSFGKSSRRSRSRTGSAPPKREDATMQSADKLFSNYIANRQQANNATTTATANATAVPTQRKSSYLGQAAPQSQDDPASVTQALTYRKEPTEVILRGYASQSQQYAAINHYEQVAGRICEDYSREPPIESRRYKSDLRDPALTRRQPLTPEERAKVSRVAAGEHWVKVTFESSEAAESATYVSPQNIMGHLVFAEIYHGLPPLDDRAMPDNNKNGSQSFRSHSRRSSQPFEDKTVTPAIDHSVVMSDSPPGSQVSTQTIDTATASTVTMTGALPDSPVREEIQIQPAVEETKSRRLEGARIIKVLPAEQALAPQRTMAQWLLSWIPLVGWFGGSMIGNEVPRNDVGEFDFQRASLYWQLMFYLDLWFGLFSRELVSGDKDD